MNKEVKILHLNAFHHDAAAGLRPEIRELVGRRDRVFGPNAVLFHDMPIRVAHAEGAWLHDVDGTAYLDAYNNVPSVGHCHPHVVEAVSRQLGTLNTHTRYLYEIVCDYSEKLLATFPREISNVAFTCTGSEGSDLALRIARHHTGGTGIVVTDYAYHGNTTAVAEISPATGEDVPLGAQVRTVPPPDPRRCPGEEVGAWFAANVRRAIADLRRHGIRFAALVADTIFSSDGIYADPPGALAEAAAAAREAGGLFIADEVQPGFARTGERMWGFQRHGLVPDLVVMGKPMGNGFPVAGVAARPEVFADFSRRAGYFNTFGGNPVAAAAGRAVLEVLARERLMDNAREVGEHLRQGFRRLAEAHPGLAEVRGAGLYIGVEFRDPGEARRMVSGLRRRNVLIGTAGPKGDTLKIRPPLCFSRANADLLLGAAEEVLREV